MQHSPAHPAPRSLPHIPALDGLRGLAILLVLMHHAGIVRKESTGVVGWVYSNIASMGWVGVDLFFVLSGFLIGAILVRCEGQPNWIRNFMARRALRVLPLYFIVIFVCFNVLILIPFRGTDWLRELRSDQIWYWLHIANFRRILVDLDPTAAPVEWFSTYWSLSIEEHFYLAWPIVIVFCGTRSLWKASVAGIAGVILLRTAIALGEFPDSLIYNNTFTRIDGLMLGTLLAWLHHFHPERLARAKWIPAIAFVLGFLAFFIPMTLGYHGGGRRTLYGLLVLYTASISIGGATVWYLVTQGAENPIARVFSMNWLRSFGKYSYAIYVFNKPIILGIAIVCKNQFGRLSTLQGLVAFAVIAALCWSAGWLSWRLIEEPFLRLKRYFPTRPASHAET